MDSKELLTEMETVMNMFKCLNKKLLLVVHLSFSQSFCSRRWNQLLINWLVIHVLPKLPLHSKWIVTALFGAFVIWRHDAEALWFAGGSVLNAMLSVLLKQILNQKRPSTLKSDPGMPSSHSQSIFFGVMFIILSSVESLSINAFTITSSCLALALGSYMSYLRVSQKLHTVSQVIVGAFVGSICSILWYWLWNGFMLNAFVSSLWVRIIVILGSAGICLGFLLYVIRHWLKEE
uniref:Lipid phosphate phosphatase epsilon 2, chloroplastic isoform X3 n=1 Tax=Cicer arietinum TaxID=3827 RepID=A0A1S3EFF7_CICAR|nr:lipid phosphate phosphatase epsilon 2, chloroplastic isoform X3 [Cicer arietinum]